MFKNRYNLTSDPSESLNLYNEQKEIIDFYSSTSMTATDFGNDANDIIVNKQIELLNDELEKLEKTNEKLQKKNKELSNLKKTGLGNDEIINKQIDLLNEELEKLEKTNEKLEKKNKELSSSKTYKSKLDKNEMELTLIAEKESVVRELDQLKEDYREFREHVGEQSVDSDKLRHDTGEGRVKELRSFQRLLQKQHLARKDDAPSLELVIRTHAGSIRDLNTYLFPGLIMFVDKFKIQLTFILDAESEVDRGLETCIRRHFDRYNVNVYYEPEPEDAEEYFGGDLCKSHPRWGYHKQLWSTWIIDMYTTADVVGILDADTGLHGLITNSTIFDDEGRLMLRSMDIDDGWEYNSIIGQDIIDKGEWLSVMNTETFPQWLYRSAWKHARAEVIDRLGVDTIFDAWKVMKRHCHSPIAMIATFGYQAEPDKYSIYSRERKKFVISPGYNGHPWSRPGMTKIGCCALFQDLEPCDEHRYTKAGISFGHWDEDWGLNDLIPNDVAHVIIEKYMQELEYDTDTMEDTQKNEMKAACEQLVDEDKTLWNICLPNG
eukprot:UN31140